ncbi:hypothetical protein SAMN05518672_10615 [Chitinophaga sp. CF118]|uniref:hypothetical protein n=1 Tax=Chitinophaga sp. CF118 TaxID=1884367 RepID=UPI0008E0F282|nr:hypothetical protein [Chitinophaga sp. CF118]SFE40383.1 hypothetical protein SAMN05518672_10615 [Chitinophaga sp. CF118]
MSIYDYCQITEIQIEYLGKTHVFKDSNEPHNDWQSATKVCTDVMNELRKIKEPKSFLFIPKYKVRIDRNHGGFKNSVECKGTNYEMVVFIEFWKLDCDKKNIYIDYRTKKIPSYEDFQIWEKVIDGMIKTNSKL